MRPFVSGHARMSSCRTTRDRIVVRLSPTRIWDSVPLENRFPQIHGGSGYSPALAISAQVACNPFRDRNDIARDQTCTVPTSSHPEEHRQRHLVVARPSSWTDRLVASSLHASMNFSRSIFPAFSNDFAMNARSCNGQGADPRYRLSSFRNSSTNALFSSCRVVEEIVRRSVHPSARSAPEG